jgi:hypothetical protein
MSRKLDDKQTNNLFFSYYYQISEALNKLIKYKIVITVKRDSRVEDIQDQFTAAFPFLRVEFLKTFSNTRAERKTKYARPHDSFKRIPGFIDEGKIDMYATQTIATVENNFKEHLGVSAQVFRRSGDIWIETTLTEDWTLEQQNKIGEQITHYREAQNFLVGQVS